MTTGVESVDDQHRQLIAQLNGLLEAMAAGQGRAAIEPLIKALRTYTTTHFAHEEACMQRYACPVATLNVGQHKAFVAKVEQIDKEFRANGASSTLAIRVQRELADWLGQHIKGTDTNLRACVRAA